MSGGATERIADFDLTPEQRLVRRAVRDFAERELLPYVEEYERAARYPLEQIAKLVPLGYIAPMIPEEYGGSFIDVTTYGIICEELARVDWVVASVVSVANSLAASSILRWGSEEQKQRWLPPIARGEVLCSACLTEPGGGTDLANMRTTATPVDGGFRLQGSKVFISHAAHAGLFFVVATVDRAQQHEGVTALLVDPKSPGIRIGDFPMRTLQRDNLAEVHFEDVFVPASGLLGRAGGGFPVLGQRARHGPLLGGGALRGAGAALHRSLGGLRHPARGLRPEDRRVPDDPAEDRRHGLPHRGRARDRATGSGRMKDAGVQRASLESSMAKLMASEAATQNALDAIQIHGGYGLSAEYEVGRLLMEAKALELGEGTSELHRKLIAEFALGIRKQ